jgi:hypothetical protein
VVIPRGSKPPKGKAGLRPWETSVTRSKETHASSTHEDDVEDDTGEGNPSLKGKRAASEDAEAEVRTKGQKRPHKASVESACRSAPPKKANFSDESDVDLFELGREKPAPRRYVIVTICGLYEVLSSR